MAQDVGGFAHFHHEGGAVGGEVVGGADAGENLVDLADAGGFGGHEAAGVGKQNDVGDLAHIGGFAAHIGAGEQHEAVFVVEAGVVGGEVRHLAFNHGVAAVVDFDAGVVGKLWGVVIVFGGKVGKAAEDVQRGGGLGGTLQQGQLLLELLQQAVVEAFFEGEGALLGVEHFVFEGFELGGDEAFGVFQGLAALVVGGGFGGLDFGKLDVETVYAVVFDFEGGEAGALAFAGFEFEQEVAAVVLDAAQFVELGGKAVVDYAAVAQPYGGFGQDSGL